METVENTIIGAGVIGLAIARALSAKHPNTLILEKNPRIGEGISSRSSEVIHAGIYYPPDSLKARLCVRGKALLYNYCQTHQIPFQKTGKLIVATHQNQLPALENLQQQAINNGVTDLTLLDQQQTHRLEPEVNAIASLLSPSSGIIDSHQLMLSLQGEAESNGASLAVNTQVDKIQPINEGFLLQGESSNEPFLIKTRRLILAAGLSTQALAKKIGTYPKAIIPELFLVKGNYFSLRGPAPFKHLIYPMPETNLAGLGVHATLDLSGAVRFGPDVMATKYEDYRVNEARLEHFYENIKNYWPNADQKRLTPDYAGIRPKLSAPGSGFQDFCIQDSKTHRLSNLIVLMGIESPGLTASLAIAEYIAGLV